MLSGCGGVIHAKSGQITSPNYPDDYGSSTECVWDINVPSGYHVSLKFNDTFSIEHSPTCSNDYVQVSFTILPCDAMHNRGLCRYADAVSVCPSVRTSVTFVNSVKTSSRPSILVIKR